MSDLLKRLTELETAATQETDAELERDMSHCEHHYCRCLRAAELAMIAERTGQARYLMDAIAVHYQKVPCREQSERGKDE